MHVLTSTLARYWAPTLPNHNFGALLLLYSYKHLVIAADLNQHLVQRRLTTFLRCLVSTITSSSPLISQDSHLTLPSNMVNCRPLATVGSSDHLAVLIKIKLAIVRDEGMTHTNWLWDKWDWDAARAVLNHSVVWHACGRRRLTSKEHHWNPPVLPKKVCT